MNAVFQKIGRNIERYIPLIETVRTYKKEYARKDIIAALTVAVVSLPQSMAYAIIAGVNPVYGLYTAIVSTIFASIFGSSNHLIAGPTNAISLLIASNMRNFMGRENAYEMLFLMTLVVGVLQMLFGFIKLGKAINYVSHAVVVGFTAGAGVIIALGQLNQLFGISVGSGYMPLIEKVYRVFLSINKTNLYALGLALLTIAIIIICKKISKNLPGALLGIVASMILVIVFGLEQKGVKLTGNIPAALPPFTMVHFDYTSFKEVFAGALAVAIIGLVEAISIAKSIASTSEQKIDANQEFIGQGLANALSSFFQCFAGSGSFTRSAINYYNGAATRISGILSGIIVALILIFCAPYAKYIPMASLAGVIMTVAYSMVNKKEMSKIHKAGGSDAVVLWITVAATVFMPDLEWAIYAGIAISIGLYLKDTNTVPVKLLIPMEDEQHRFIEKQIATLNDKVDITIIQMEGNLYFGASNDLEIKLDSLIGKSNIYILRMKRVSMIDITILETIGIFIRRVIKSGGHVIICGVGTALNTMLSNTKLADEIGADNIFLSEDKIFASSMKAIEKANKLLKDTHL